MGQKYRPNISQVSKYHDCVRPKASTITATNMVRPTAAATVTNCTNIMAKNCIYMGFRPFASPVLLLIRKTERKVTTNALQQVTTFTIIPVVSV